MASGRIAAELGRVLAFFESAAHAHARAHTQTHGRLGIEKGGEGEIEKALVPYAML